jgi:parvulin-like peptidyl-prolyl isomerase
MSNLQSVSPEEVFSQIKLSGQLPAIREAITTREIILETAAEFDIKVSPEEIQEASNQFRKTNNLLRAEETWAWMEIQGIDLKEFEEMIYLELLKNKLAEYLFAEKVESYFAMHQLDFTTAALYEACLEDEDIALELFYSLKEGEITFYEVAQQYIQDQELRRKGGYCGFVTHSQLPPEVSAAVFSASPSQLLKPIITAKGIYLVYVEEVIQTKLDIDLRQKIMFAMFFDWIKQRIKDDEIL